MNRAGLLFTLRHCNPVSTVEKIPFGNTKSNPEYAILIKQSGGVLAYVHQRGGGGQK